MQQQETFRKIFNRDPEAPVTVSFLRNVTESHPYFGAAHFYLLKNMKEDGAVAEKTALFFNDPYMLSAELNKTGIADLPPQESIPAPAQHIEEPETVTETVQEETADVPVAETQTAPPAAKDEILFEPLHASDYFASQGIKLSEDMLDADKLGKQLKSFTAWLKTMKKLQTGKLPETGIATETAMQNLAEKSNTGEEVLTEAMAEAFIIQEKKQKAIEVYEKLSLLNPSKSAYFAAKIESLK